MKIWIIAIIVIVLLIVIGLIIGLIVFLTKKKKQSVIPGDNNGEENEEEQGPKPEDDIPAPPVEGPCVKIQNLTNCVTVTIAGNDLRIYPFSSKALRYVDSSGLITNYYIAATNAPLLSPTGTDERAYALTTSKANQWSYSNLFFVNLTNNKCLRLGTGGENGGAGPCDSDARWIFDGYNLYCVSCYENSVGGGRAQSVRLVWDYLLSKFVTVVGPIGDIGTLKTVSFIVE